MKYEKSCGALVFDGEKVLVIQQVKGHWGFPKGHVEGNETEVETAIREIKEETNLDIKINEKYRYMETYSPSEGVKKDVVYFVAEKTGGKVEVQEEEVIKVEWLTCEEALEKLTYEESKNILRSAMKDMK